MLNAADALPQPLVFGEARVAEAQAALERIENTVKNLDWLCGNADASAASVIDLRCAFGGGRERPFAAFEQAMDDDFNTAGALGEIFTFVGEVNTLAGGGSVSADDAVALGAARAIRLVELMDVLGVAGVDEDEGSAAYPAEVVDLAADLAGYAGADALEAVDALLAAQPPRARRRTGLLPTACATVWSPSDLLIEDTPQGARVTFEG